MRTIRRFIEGALGIRRRRYQNVTRFRHWCSLCRREGHLMELVLTTRSHHRENVELALRKHRVQMAIFLENVS